MNDSQWLIVAGSIGQVITLGGIIGLVFYIRRYVRGVRDSLAEMGRDIEQLRTSGEELTERVDKIERDWGL